MSELAKKLILIHKITKDPFLDLGNCGLENYIPSELFECTWLKGLSLGGGYLNKSSGIWVSSLNRGMKNSFKGIELTILEKLPFLENLCISDIQIKNYNFLEKLKKLQYLDLSYNQISNISFLEKLTGLISLYLNSNQISDIHHLEKITSLKILNLSSNRVSNVNYLEKLTNLQYIDLSSNQISDVNSFNIHAIEKLKDLKNLNLINNQIRDIQFLVPLLRRGFEIDLFEDKNITQLHKIGLKDNYIIAPPFEIIVRGSKAVINWFGERDKQGEETVYEAKLMIIGDAGSGKTSLSTKIKNLKAPLPNKIDDTTVGINISEFEFKNQENKHNFKVHIWDLGGQKIYHPLHQLFFSRRSLYILVANGREDKGLDDFWIPVQELLGKDSPMLILFNQHGTIQPSIPFRNLKANYPNIRGDLSVVNLLNDEHKMEDFIQEVEKFLRNLPQFERGEKLPKLWIRIKEVITTKKENYIELVEFRKLCTEIGITDFIKQDFVSDYLHDLGIILRFRDDTLLKKIIFLKPQWALDAIYSVLDHTRENKNGLFKKQELISVWQNEEFYDTQDELLALMKKFELCYEITPEQYLIPSLLSEDLPSDFDWDKTNNTMLHYEYDFMPKGIISRLIVRLHRLIPENQLVWREGVVFEYQGALIWVTKFANKRIEIYAKGYKTSSLITLVTHEIDDINDKYHFSERSKPIKKVPCLCAVCSQSNTPTYYTYEDLILRDINNKKTIECSQVPFKEVKVKKLLENVHDNTIILREKMKNNSKEPIKVFVTYCWTDENNKKDEEHQKEVRQFVDGLSDYQDFNATFDLYESEDSTATNFMKMMYTNLEKSRKIVIILSEGYAQKANGFLGSVGIEYKAIMNDIGQNPRKYILVSFDKRRGEIYPFGLQGHDTLTIKNGDIELTENQENKNRLFSKLKDEAIYERPEPGTKTAVIIKR
ncbi:MAG: leucine-rich repeat domain-containing protein [Arcicella sp.]|jgi:hypothetical protein|nr:leucine-rich repeat domain-containing protein [Arcicella sp.]